MQERVAKLSVLWPGPLTLVLPRVARVPDLATAGIATVGIRVPDRPVASDVIRLVGEPLVAPSANRFGRVSAMSPADVEAELLDVPVINGGPCRVGVVSTVVGFDEDGLPRLPRAGGIGPEVVAAVLSSRARTLRRRSRPGHIANSRRGPVGAHPLLGVMAGARKALR